MGGCQNYGPFLGTLNNRCRTIIGTKKGTIILTTTHMLSKEKGTRASGLGKYVDDSVFTWRSSGWLLRL